MELRDGVGRLAGLAVLLGGLAGCHDDPRLAEQRELLDREQTRRMAALERIEARLLALRARESQWNELRERHEKVSAIACEQAAEHVAAMRAHDARQREKSRRLARSVAEAKLERAEHTRSFRTVASEKSSRSSN